MSIIPNLKLHIRLAETADIEPIRELLADDELGKQREDLSKEGLLKYRAAFARIQNDPGNDLYVAELEERLVGTFQLTWIPYLSRAGSLRCLIEAVRVATELRNQGLGEEMMRFAVERAEDKGCALVQLTTDKTRDKAHRFYQRLGFESSHIGMKLKL